MGIPGCPPAEGGVPYDVSAETEGHFVECLDIRADFSDSEGEALACCIGLEVGLAEGRFIAEEVEVVTCGDAVKGDPIVVAEVYLVMWYIAVVSQAEMDGHCFLLLRGVG